MAAYNKLNSGIIRQLIGICGKEHVLISEDALLKYGQDETEDLSFPPEVVVRPGCAEEISKIMLLCNECLIPLTPISARTGLSGGALPVFGGIGLSVERLNHILEIDECNLQATVEPAVITQVFQEAVQDKGLYYPPDPASRGSCSIG
ncbi:MAG: FAD-binding oxidoreductase, partial [Flavobacteriales bacterium]